MKLRRKLFAAVSSLAVAAAVLLTGCGALHRGLEELIEEKTGINTMTAEDPMKVVAIGTGQFVEFMSGRKD